MKIENKKTVILTVIGVLALLISVIGATYAYFTVNTDNKFETPKIEAITGALGNVKLVSTENNLYLNLRREDMMEDNEDIYFAVTDPNGSPIGLYTGRGGEGYDELMERIEKAENGELTDEELEQLDADFDEYFENFSNNLYSLTIPTIGYIEVDGAETYDCDYTFEVTIEGNMKDALTEADKNALHFGIYMFDGEPDYAEGSNLITRNYYDIYNTEFPLEISGTLYDISSANKVYINAMLKLDTGYEQNHLIDKNMKLNIKAKSLSCTANKVFEGGNTEELTTYALSTGDLWDMTAEVGIDVMDVQEYRYVGTNPSNYICFGTSDKDTCLNDTDKYMYRIIGVFEDESGNKHAKLIKKEALNTAYAWNASYTTDVDWNKSDLYNGLNGSYFLTNASYPYMQESTWTDKIATWNYTMTKTNINAYEGDGPNYHLNAGKLVYLHELNRSGKSSETCLDYHSQNDTCTDGEWKTLKTKISLMYASDYALSLGSVALNYTSKLNYSTLKTGWIYLSNNDSSAPGIKEWTMTRVGRDDVGYYNAFYVSSGGDINNNYSNNVNVARPVFYLESDVEISDGKGTISEPYILK